MKKKQIFQVIHLGNTFYFFINLTKFILIIQVICGNFFFHVKVFSVFITGTCNWKLKKQQQYQVKIPLFLCQVYQQKKKKYQK